MNMAKTELDNNSAVKDLNIFRDIRNHVRRKINDPNSEVLREDLKAQWHELYDLVKRSIEDSESNSVVIRGSPGCGKTTLVNDVLRELSEKNILHEDTATVIRLNGLVHTDDRLALQAITKQINNAADIETKVFASFQENLIYLLQTIKEQKLRTQKACVIFILDEFHLFCKHKNQILLYNMFDVVQSSLSPICVIGLTHYADVMDLLEKRVLSRFSHRTIHLEQNVTVERRLEVFKQIFTLKPEELPNVEEVYQFVWNARTDELIENKEVKRLLEQQLNVDPSHIRFRNMLFKLFSSLTFEQPLLTIENMKQVFGSSDMNVLLLSKLSLLEIALVIAIKHQTVNNEREPFNFEMIQVMYLKFAKTKATNLVTEKPVVLKAFQRLQELEIIVPVKKSIGNSMGKIPLEYQLYHFNLSLDQVSEAIQMHKDLTAELQQWSVETF